MAQLRFHIGVPQAGSAAREAEASPERFRSLRPQAGSAARQAEEERRQRALDGTTRPLHTTTLHMRGASQGESATISSAFSAADPRPAQTAAESAAALPSLDPAEQTTAGAITAPATPDNVTASQTSPESGPLQTAAAKFKTLFRSLLGGSAGGN